METEIKGRRPYKLAQLFHIMGACWGPAAYGYTASVIGTTLGQPSFVKAMKLDTSPNAAVLIGAMNALFYVGGFIGTFLSGYLAERWGRKFAMLTGFLIILISTALAAGSVNIAMFIVFRTLCGLG
jgi:MFS family permease